MPAEEGGREEPQERAADSLEKALPILILVIVVGFVLGRLPKIEGVDHSAAYRRRRVMNWLPLGLTYAFLYMGRYGGHHIADSAT